MFLPKYVLSVYYVSVLGYCDTIANKMHVGKSVGGREGAWVIFMTGFVCVKMCVSVRMCVFCVSTAVLTYVMDTYDGMRVSLSYCVNAIMMCAADSVYVLLKGVYYVLV